jgi:RNA polymerase sigma-54 factor
MAIELGQQLRLTQQLIMTPQLQQAIKLLQLSRLELVDMIRQEMEQNPALEEVQDTAADDQAAEITQQDTPAMQEVKIDEKVPSDIDWDNYIDEYNSTGKTHFEFENKDTPSFESFVASKTSLEDHLLWQLLMTLPTKEEEKIGSVIIGNLNQDGYLVDLSIDEIAKLSESPPEKVRQVLNTLQSFDPPGVCARNLSECLQIQIRILGLENSILTEILQKHIKHLENKNYKAISKALKISLQDVISAVNLIKELEPKPGRQFTQDEPQYITPDIYVYKLDDDFVILLNDDGMPKLHINPYYKKAVTRGEKIAEETKEYLQEKMRSAQWLIKSIHQRQKTIYNVMKSIVKFQHEFFEKGIAYLKPMVLRDVAQDIGMHESTISRVTTNKYAYTPQGIFELKYFFNSSINRIHGAAIASASVQDKIKQIIEKEDPRKPYSDEKIAAILEEANINIARRTVAKYREMLKILPSNKRKQF